MTPSNDAPSGEERSWLELPGLVTRIVGFGTLGVYAYSALRYFWDNARMLADFERAGLEFIKSLLATAPAAHPAIAALPLIIGFILLCILIAVFAIFVFPKWVERIEKVWKKVTNCNWLKSFKDFLLCLAGSLLALVETIVLVLVFFVIIIVTSINVAPFLP